MNILVSGKNMKVRDDVREYAEKKLEKFEKFFRSDIEAHLTVSHIKDKQVVELTIPLKNAGIFRVEEITDDMYKSIDFAVDKLTKQITKHKTALKKRYQSHDTIRFDYFPEYVLNEVETNLKIVKNKKFYIKPMDAEEAVLQMEMLGHNFYVFRNGETDEINVVYSRKDGSFGLIEPEF
jgi:putative sigma-54 modulation protein